MSRDVENPADMLNVLEQVVSLAHRSGARLSALFSSADRVHDRDSIMTAYRRIEEESARGLREDLTALRADARWLDDDPESHAAVEQRTGEWWVVDGVEGAVNFIHGVEEFSVNITLVRDNQPVLAVVHQPVGDLTYTALAGGGAQLNGSTIAVSTKTDLGLAIITTSQAGGDAELYRRTARSIEAAFSSALAVRQTVPSTFPLLRVAAGQYDAYWRHGPDVPALAPGVLLAAEAGAMVTDLAGSPWAVDSRDVVVAPPALHGPMLRMLDESTTQA